MAKHIMVKLMGSINTGTIFSVIEKKWLKLHILNDIWILTQFFSKLQV